jgi:transcriptional regulator with XRE-family HTH domain
MKHADLRKQALRQPGVKAEYEALGPELEILRQMLNARTKAGLSQADVATRMGTQAPAITRLESALSCGKHSPSIDTLKRYAAAVGCELQVKFVQNSKPNKRFKPTATPEIRSGAAA